MGDNEILIHSVNPATFRLTAAAAVHTAQLIGAGNEENAGLESVSPLKEVFTDKTVLEAQGGGEQNGLTSRSFLNVYTV